MTDVIKTICPQHLTETVLETSLMFNQLTQSIAQQDLINLKAHKIKLLQVQNLQQPPPPAYFIAHSITHLQHYLPSRRVHTYKPTFPTPTVSLYTQITVSMTGLIYLKYRNFSTLIIRDRSWWIWCELTADDHKLRGTLILQRHEVTVANVFLPFRMQICSPQKTSEKQRLWCNSSVKMDHT
jgi:hypothetical protein